MEGKKGPRAKWIWDEFTFFQEFLSRPYQKDYSFYELHGFWTTLPSIRTFSLCN